MSKAGKRMIVNNPAVTVGIDIGKYTHVAVAHARRTLHEDILNA